MKTKQKPITLKRLLNDEKYRKMSAEELERVIDLELGFQEFLKLEGKWAEHKAKALIEKWNSEKPTK